jgi:hypothetical protein
MSVTLHDFVKQALLDISNAVHEAQCSAPHWIAPGRFEEKPILNPQMIEFSVQVSATEEKKQKGEGEISVPVITIFRASIAGEIDSVTEKQTTQTLKFSVPVYFQSRKKEAEPASTAQRR